MSRLPSASYEAGTPAMRLGLRVEVGGLAAAERVRELGCHEAVSVGGVGRLVVDFAAAGLAVEVGEDPVLDGLVAGERVRLRVAVAAVRRQAGREHGEALRAGVAELPQGMHG